MLLVGIEVIVANTWHALSNFIYRHSSLINLDRVRHDRLHRIIDPHSHFFLGCRSALHQIARCGSNYCKAMSLRTSHVANRFDRICNNLVYLLQTSAFRILKLQFSDQCLIKYPNEIVLINSETRSELSILHPE